MCLFLYKELNLRPNRISQWIFANLDDLSLIPGPTKSKKKNWLLQVVFCQPHSHGRAKGHTHSTYMRTKWINKNAIIVKRVRCQLNKDSIFHNEIIMRVCTVKTLPLGLQRWTGREAHWLLLQRTGVWLPVPVPSGSQLPVKPQLQDIQHPLLSSESTHAPMYIHIHADTCTHT